MRLLTVFFCLSILFIAGTQAAWSRHHHGFNWRRCANYNYRGNNWNRYRNNSGNGYFNGYGPGYRNYGNYSGYANYSPFLRQIFRY